VQSQCPCQQSQSPFKQTSCRPADLHAPPHSSLVASPHESEGPFASSLWGQSWHGLPLRATPCSPQSFRSSTNWPALGLCRDPYTLWDPVPHSLIKHCWYTRVQHVLGLEPNVAKYISSLGCSRANLDAMQAANAKAASSALTLCVQ